VGCPDGPPIEVPYNRDLKALEEALVAVRRPGDFFVRGTLETPMPRVEIDGVGVIAFPILASQVGNIIKHAERAPYGRGCETILDTSVRKARQLRYTAFSTTSSTSFYGQRVQLRCLTSGYAP
jgi:hypothetical protein